jgi:acetate kinase
VRRYGFHGLSYEYVVASLGAKALGRAVLAHLGGGSSLAAVRDGHSVDTTMGFTPAGGLVMGTRPGDMDPSLVVYLLGRGYDARSLGELLNTQCGLQGLSGSTSDVRELLARRKGDPRAKMALDVYVFSARKWVGAMAAVLGGIDTLVFTGGIGEHAPSIRAEIACGLEHLGVHVDAARNDQNAAIISPDGTSCSVYVVRTDEERMVARHTRALVASAQAARGRATEFP